MNPRVWMNHSTSPTALSEIEAFLAVADHLGFGAAARELAVSQSTISRRISHLEARLGQRLVMRTTRKTSLTDAGLIYAAEVREVMARITMADARLQNRAAEPEGMLRLTMPTAFGRAHVLPRITRLAERYPRLRFELDLSDRYVDLLEGHFDLAIRMATPVPSGVVTEVIHHFGVSLCAAPGYLARHGQLAHPADIAAHCFVGQRTYAPRVDWQVRWLGTPMDLQTHPRISVSDATSLLGLVLNGAGLAVLPSYLSAPFLASGELVAALPGLVFPSREMVAAYLRHRVDLSKLRVLLDALREAPGRSG